MFQVILVVLFFIIWFLLIYLCSPKIKINSNIKTIGEILKNVDNGDLLFLSGDTIPERAIRFYTLSSYSHVGLIFLDFNKKRTKKIPYVWEADMGGGRKDGPRVLKLKTKLLYPGKSRERIAMIKILNENITRPSTEKILKSIRKNVDKTMDTSMISWLFATYPNSSLFKYVHSDKKVFCSELVASTLINLDLIERDVHPAYFSPEYIRGLEIYNKEIFVNLF